MAAELGEGSVGWCWGRGQWVVLGEGSVDGVGGGISGSGAGGGVSWVVLGEESVGSAGGEVSGRGGEGYTVSLNCFILFVVGLVQDCWSHGSSLGLSPLSDGSSSGFSGQLLSWTVRWASNRKLVCELAIGWVGCVCLVVCSPVHVGGVCVSGGVFTSACGWCVCVWRCVHQCMWVGCVCLEVCSPVHVGGVCVSGGVFTSACGWCVCLEVCSPVHVGGVCVWRCVHQCMWVVCVSGGVFTSACGWGVCVWRCAPPVHVGGVCVSGGVFTSACGWGVCLEVCSPVHEWALQRFVCL